MRLKTENITENSRFWDKINSLASEAFPPEEYLAPSELVKMARADNFDFFALLDEERFVGFAVIQLHGDIAYLFFLAIDSPLRNMGCGSRAIETLREKYPDKKHIVDFEMPDPTAANRVQREKRRLFYLKNGYRETGWFLSYLGVDYEVFCTGGEFDIEDFKELMKNVKVEGLSPVYFRKDGKKP